MYSAKLYSKQSPLRKKVSFPLHIIEWIALLTMIYKQPSLKQQ